MEHDHARRRHDREGRKRSRGRSASPGGDDRRRRREGDRHRRRRDGSPKRRKKGKHRRDSSGSDSRSDSSSVSSSSSTSSRSERRKRHSKKRRRKDKKGKKDKKKRHREKKDRKRKSKKTSRRRSRSRSPSDPPPATISVPVPPGAHELASALTQLFDAYPAMSTLDGGGIPLLFIKLGGGTEYDLSQMPDGNLARLLGVVFQALRVHGMELGGNGAWRWNNPAPIGQQGGDNLALLRLARALLNGVGFTMERVQRYERDRMQTTKQPQQPEVKVASDDAEKAERSESEVRHKKRVERMTSQMLDRFDPKNSSASESSLANELQGICDILAEGESVQLDGIENGKLRATLTQLFQLVGLTLVEMEDEEGSEAEEGGDANSDTQNEKVMGFALPSASDVQDIASSNLNEVLRVCRFRSSGGIEGVPTSWGAKRATDVEQEEESSDEDDGPAPLGTMAAVKAASRKRPPLIQNKDVPGGSEEGGREEWMMVPGEHDFLKGIQSKSFRGRTFKNEKNRGQSIAPSAQRAEPIDPKVLEEVDAIQQAYQESRGPSLMDSHRQKQMEAKQQQQGQKKEFKWSRDKNLDDGRRVDRNALHMVLGDASTELKSKFQGSLGR